VTLFGIFPRLRIRNASRARNGEGAPISFLAFFMKRIPFTAISLATLALCLPFLGGCVPLMIANFVLSDNGVRTERPMTPDSIERLYAPVSPEARAS